MLFKFSSHTLEESEYGYIVTLYMEAQTEEFANEFNTPETSSTSTDNLLNRSIMSYIKHHLANIKIYLIRVMAGSVLLLTISMTALEASLQVAHASTIYTQTQIQNAVRNSSANIVLDNELLTLPQKPFILDGITYAPIREICEALGANVTWNQDTNNVQITKGTSSLSFKVGESTCILDNQKVSMPQSMIVNDKTMVSLRFLSETFGFKVDWNDNLKVAILSSNGVMPTEKELESLVPKPAVSYSQDDLYWLARLVHSEARGESYEGKLAVANVILNRVRSGEFPNTVKEVIFDNKYGVQFTPTINGEIYKEPSSESEQAAIEALEGNNNAKNALYFLNPRKATSSWVQSNRKYAFSIQNHNFYF